MAENEVWAVIKDYPNYMISTLGNVHSSAGSRPVLLNPCTNGMGYKVVGLYKNKKCKLFLVHVLVLEAFDKPRPFNLVCMHLDDNKSNNRLENLRWDTQANNLWQITKRQCRRFTKTEVQELRSSQATHTALAKQYGVSISHMANIRNGERYGT